MGVKNNKGKTAPKYQGYVRYVVDKALKTAVNQNTLVEPALMEYFVRVCEDQVCKFSLAYDESSDTFTAGLYGHTHESAHPGVGLNARHSESLKALRLLYELHENVFSHSWPFNPEEAADQYNW